MEQLFKQLECDNSNGNGFVYCNPATTVISNEQGYFPEQSRDIVQTTMQTGDCYVWGLPGAGKSHLAIDLIRESRRQEVPSLSLAAQINGGSKKGVDNAKYVIDTFTERHSDGGLIIVDNVDYYGYSGSRARRRYGVAEAHLEVAGQIKEIIDDNSTQIGVCGIGHVQSWRDSHWLFREKKGDDDRVSSQAQALLDSFKSDYLFEGNIEDEVARRLLLSREVSEYVAEDLVTQLKVLRGVVLFRHVNHLITTCNSPDSLEEDVERIDKKTASLIGSFVL